MHSKPQPHTQHLVPCMELNSQMSARSKQYMFQIISNSEPSALTNHPCIDAPKYNMHESATNHQQSEKTNVQANPVCRAG